MIANVSAPSGLRSSENEEEGEDEVESGTEAVEEAPTSEE